MMKQSTASKDDFFTFPDYQQNGSFLIKNMTLLQADIACHSKISKENAPERVMEAKLYLARQLQDVLGELGFRGVYWAGDGGMFAIELTSSTTCMALVDAWTRIRLVLSGLNAQYEPSLKDKIRLRVSAHIATVQLHSDPRYWHSDELNFFAKKEREIGAVDVFRITRAVYDNLPHILRPHFKQHSTIDSDPKHEIFEFNGNEKTQHDIPNPMRQISPVIIRIIKESSEYRKHFHRSSRGRKRKGDLLFIIDVQKDFCDPTSTNLAHLYVRGTKELIPSLNELVCRAEKKGVPIVFTRDWHPGDHPSFLDNDGVWKAHCVAHSKGAEFHDQLRIPNNAHIVNIGTVKKKRDYTPYSDPALLKLIDKFNPKRILIAGIALEYCVLATCLDSIAHADEVVVLKNHVLAAEPDSEGARTVWNALENAGLKVIADSTKVF